jgi:periplasmic protein TonB
MVPEKNSVLDSVKSFLGWILALKVSEQERLRYADDPLNIFGEDYSNRRPLVVSAVLAILFHLVVLLVSLPFLAREVLIPQQPVMVLKQIALPAQQMGGGPPEPDVPEPEPERVAPQPRPVVVPIPDPTPAEPEPLVREITLDAPEVVDEYAADFSIGDVSAPAGHGAGVAGTGTGPSRGPGPAAGAGDGVYEIGSDITNPVIVNQTIPSYTDEAIKAKAQGIVLLEAIIRKDGRVTDFRVLRGLGYGLEERAIEEIASNWKFRPGTKDGRPVDVRATIEVQFNLR